MNSYQGFLNIFLIRPNMYLFIHIKTSQKFQTQWKRFDTRRTSTHKDSKNQFGHLAAQLIVLCYCSRYEK